MSSTQILKIFSHEFKDIPIDVIIRYSLIKCVNFRESEEEYSS